MTPAHPRTALVTGATSDLGRATCAALAASGVRVLGLARPGARLDALSDAEPVPVDLEQPASTWRLPEAVDVLVHAAAAHPAAARIERTTAHDDHAAWVIGPGALTALCRALTPGMRRRGWGRVVAVGSSAGHLGSPGQHAYAASKAALVGAVRSLAVELGREGVTVNLVVPGLLDTHRARTGVADDARAWLVRQTAVGRAGTPAEVAALITFLCGDAAAYITGATLHVDGGLGLGAGLAGMRP
jgi:NAD(P)-dependent dehydrogenase (short-subunit alcohol dehydrogenase family)